MSDEQIKSKQRLKPKTRAQAVREVIAIPKEPKRSTNTTELLKKTVHDKSAVVSRQADKSTTNTKSGASETTATSSSNSLAEVSLSACNRKLEAVRDNINICINRSGLSLSQVARKMGETIVDFQSIISGDRSLSVEWTAKLAAVLGMPVDEVLFGRQVDVDTAAQIVGIDASMIRRYAAQQRLPSRRIGQRTLVFWETDLRAFQEIPRKPGIPTGSK